MKMQFSMPEQVYIVHRKKKLFDIPVHSRDVTYQTLPGRESLHHILTINVPDVYMGRYEVVLRGDYP